jgi:hypothetical protein
MKNQTTLTHEEIQNGTQVAWEQHSTSFFHERKDGLTIQYSHRYGGIGNDGVERRENLVWWMDSWDTTEYMETKEAALKRINEILKSTGN